MTIITYIVIALFIGAATVAVMQILQSGKLKQENKSFQNIFQHTNDALMLIDIVDGMVDMIESRTAGPGRIRFSFFPSLSRLK